MTNAPAHIAATNTVATAPAPPIDCFGATANPASYVPRDDSERVRKHLERLVMSERVPVALVGPTGLGKTLMLRVLGRRLRKRFHPLYVPNPSMSLDELATLALGLANQKPSRCPARRLISVARVLQARGRGLLLLIDDASAMPTETVRSLTELVAQSDGALRVVLALGPTKTTRAVVAALGPQRRVVRLVAPMTLGETGRYVHQRIARGLGDDVARRVLPDTVMRLHRESRGIPRAVNFAADRVLRLCAQASG